MPVCTTPSRRIQRTAGAWRSMSVAMALAAALALPQTASAQAGFFGQLLFSPTYDEDHVPDTYGSEADCRNPSSGPWRGLIGGRKNVDLKTLQFSREGCFRTEAQCRAFLDYISGFLTMTFTRECRHR
ncbi:hypothetical protein [Stappia sp. MMSF_3263]|uniref:hypothetical protein n=1 Tax=Stappia sp. MMSF_3263 TaxID=3046693 RepID=UPI00273D1019|nr:hypothetical protein [Stappia sp. MMSF_3263]